MASVIIRALATLCVVLASSLVLPSVARSEVDPARPITLVVANPAGGATDQLARALAEALSRRLKQSVIISNIGGGSGAIGAKRVLHAPPDGHTLLLGTTTDMMVTPITNGDAGYGPGDFTPVAMIGSTALALVASTALHVQTIDDLLVHAREAATTLTLGVTGLASLQALAGASFSDASGVALMTVPYKGGPPLITDLIAGRIDLAITALPGVLDHARGGHLVILGVLSEARSAAAPDVPTVNESGAIKGVSVEIWAGLAGPPGLPSEVVDRINHAVQLILADTAFRESRTRAGDVVARPASAAAFRAFLADEERRYRPLAAGLLPR